MFNVSIDNRVGDGVHNMFNFVEDGWVGIYERTLRCNVVANICRPVMRLSMTTRLDRYTSFHLVKVAWLI